ncbi:alpha/beta hydrolase fold protein [Coprinopsis sp. MPI-PUGE-AT-0042]|nr:alpha/beta hydrolase fold protein [Coprinopsis sp. MPI-PUGE-AT-0042]
MVTKTKGFKLSWAGFISLVGKLIVLPIHLTWDLIVQTVFGRKLRQLPKRAVMSSVKQLLERSSMSQIQYVIGTSDEAVYSAWTKNTGEPRLVEKLVDDSVLYWIGPKQTRKVILYCHGGGFFMPVQSNTLHLWNYVRKALLEDNIAAGVVLLGYGLVPEAQFPVQLRQLCVALDHLLATGTHPSDIIIVGDSAGGNMILQLVSQLLHPLPDIGPTTRLEAPLGGAYLMSPWVTGKTTSASFQKPVPDLFDAPTIEEWAGAYAKDIPDSQKQYFEFSSTKASWFKGMSKYVKRVMVSAGDEERFLDDVVDFTTNKLPQNELDLRLEVQAGGVHIDPYFDFSLTDRPSSTGKLTPIIIDWLKEGFRAPGNDSE